MYLIEQVEQLNPEVTRMVVRAPQIARKIKPGQFIMLRIDETGERIPLTMSDIDVLSGTVTIVFQVVGATTMRLAQKKPGEYLTDFVGPLGNPTELDNVGKACVIGGGLGVAIAYPLVKWLHSQGSDVDVIVGFRNKDLVILEKELSLSASELIVTTDDGSYGVQGLVTQPLLEKLEEGVKYDLVLAIGPIPMMKAVAKVTKEAGIKTVVSMNPLMIDGTGMCGGCRVKVGDKYMHTCVDGPDFDGHQVDFDDALRRERMYRGFERQSAEHTREVIEASGGNCHCASMASAVRKEA